ncbi:CLUMA_CG006708, isoform A [Clunio marinus]|uniref:CLUMA_CG006708, isoform A n=1 Tax=Clunio marinus TaxID=568069 RepID=A0A1J1I0Q4_9DIPT|nr:CLUMA_CG006708, isoform A [Clunio marinus]
MSVRVLKSNHQRIMKSRVRTPPMMPGKKFCSHFKIIIKRIKYGKLRQYIIGFRIPIFYLKRF